MKAFKIFSVLFLPLLIASCKKTKTVEVEKIVVLNSLNDNLVAYYPFNGDVKDSTANANHLTVSGDAKLAANRFGAANKAYEFDGTGDYLSKDAGINITNPEYTISMWVRPTGYPNSNNIVCDLGSNAITNGQMMIFANGYAGYNGVYYYNGQSNNTFLLGGTNAALPAINQWYHVVLSRSNTEIRLYINNQLVQSQPSSASLPAAYMNSSIYVGTRFQNGLGQSFKGQLDDIRIYKCTLCACDIKRLYELGY